MKLISAVKIIVFLIISLLSVSVMADDSTQTNQTNTTTSAPQQNPQDANLVMTIYKRIKANSALSNTNIAVGATNGVVTLEGAVNTNAQIYSLINLVRSIQGVRDIISRLRVDPAAANNPNSPPQP